MKNLRPVVCTLTTIGRLRRGTSWKRSLDRYARRFERLPNGVFVEFKPGFPIGELRELVAAESKCCRWMNLELQEDADPPTLTITADTDEGVRAIIELAGYADTTELSGCELR